MDATTLAFAGAAEQARLIRDGEVTSRAVVEATLARIAKIDPLINAYRVVLAERALAEADQADGRRNAGPPTHARPLLGVPVAIKDDVDVAGESTAWGTAAHAGPVARDAEVIRRLRAAGAVIIGKTLVPELTMLPATDTTTFGSARNPWDLSRTPGGSSGGSGAAMAAGLAGVALGSDGAGSIRTPSTWNGLFGLKPTRDRVPLVPHDDAWQGLSVNGPLARRVVDAALFLDATIDNGVPDGGFVGAAAREPGRLRIAVSTKAPAGAMPRLGAEERRAVQDMAALLRGLGHDVVERDPDYPGSLWPAGLVRVMRGIGEDVAASMPHPERLEPRTRAVAALGRRAPASLVRWAREAEAEQTVRLAKLWEDVDVLLTPATNDGPYRVGVVGRWSTPVYLARGAERLAWMPAWNITGQPAAAVPAGLDDDGLPVGVQLVGRRGEDAVLLSLAAQIETARPWIDRRPGAIA